MCNLGQAAVISIMKACSLKSPLTEKETVTLCIVDKSPNYSFFNIKNTF